MKEYNTDNTKRKQRELLKKAIEETILKHKKPKFVKVLHFPGPNNMEWEEVYKPLGFNPKNIIGLEMGKKEFAKLTNTDPKIIPINKTLDEYITNNRLWFDIVSLDFHNYMTHETLETLVRLKQENSPQKALYHFAFLKKRENLQSQDLLSRLSFISHSMKLQVARTNPQLISNKVIEEVNRAEKLKLSEKREYGFELIMNGETTDQSHTEVRNFIDVLSKIYSQPKYEIIDTLADAIEENFIKSKLEGNSSNIIEKYGLEESSEDIKAYLNLQSDETLSGVNMFLMNELRNIIKDELRNEPLFRNISNNKNEINNNIFRKDDLLQSVANRIALGISIMSRSKDMGDITYYKKYMYTSESGAPMIGDIGFFNKHLKYVSNLKGLVNSLDFQGGVRIKKPKRFLQSINKLSKNDSPNIITSKEIKDMERIYLGGNNATKKINSEPLEAKVDNTKNEHIKKNQKKNIQKDIYDLINKNVADDEIKDKYALTTMQLAGYKAALKRGTSKIKSTLNKITEEDRVEIFEYTNAGFEALDIVTYFENKYTSAQINAAMYWIKKDNTNE